ncbi:MAG TPA: class I SAM-dependent methyltransferase [Anaerolineales bacterium]|nr:class I SAM-dependent methyltransferase [Anaerolineales bacterium]
MLFDEKYFSTAAYKDVSFAKYSQYWWSNRFYAILVRRYGQRGTRLLEIGSGLGHLVGQLEDAYATTALDVNHWALVQSKAVAPRTWRQVASAEGLPFADSTFGVIVIKHVVEHLPHPEQAIAELGRVMAPGGALILATPNLASLSRPSKGKNWIGYHDPTHISLKPPAEWLALLKGAGFKLKRVFSDGLWDAPYIPVLPTGLQKLLFGSLGGLQAVSGVVFLPMRWGESIMVIAQKQ